MITGKDARVQGELDQLPLHNARLVKVLTMVTLYCELEFKKDVVVTCVRRTPEENAAQGGIPNSPHTVWNAADLRSSTFSSTEIQKVVTFLNCLTYRAGKNTAMAHQVPGGVMHFHIQCLKENEK